MRKIFKSGKLYKKLFLLIVMTYVVGILINQQKILNSYKNEQNYYSQKIEKEMKNKEELLAVKENVDSPEYIEQIAREKLDMYLPNERVYIDIGK